MENVIQNEIKGIVSAILEDYEKNRDIDKLELFKQPDKEVVIDVLNKLLQIIYPGYFWDRNYRIYTPDNKLALLIEDVTYNLNKQIAIALLFHEDYKDKDETERNAVAEKLSVAFLKQIPKIREYLSTDLEAAYNGDPATFYKDEIILAYPGFYAITINRIAHELHQLDVPLIPRIMTEHAHSKTGIDIHPGATIGKYFFIDHGTGIVIGETTTSGENVKVYQGVTLGALSTRAGQSLRNVKRHPTIEDNVTIYSGASILGGETVIGQGSVVGSNAFITKSIAPETKVSIKNRELQYKGGQGSKFESPNVGQDDAWHYTI